MKSKTEVGRMSRWFAAAVAMGATALLGCVVRAHPVGYSVVGPPEPIVVVEPPPPARVEVRVASPGDDYLWIEGYWNWSGGQWAWVAGRWQAKREGHDWVAPQYVGRRYVPGHWARGSQPPPPMVVSPGSAPPPPVRVQPGAPPPPMVVAPAPPPPVRVQPGPPARVPPPPTAVAPLPPGPPPPPVAVQPRGKRPPPPPHEVHKQPPHKPPPRPWGP